MRPPTLASRFTTRWAVLMEFKEYIGLRGAEVRLGADEEWDLFGRLEAGIAAQAVLDGRAVIGCDASAAELEAIAVQGEEAAEQLWQAMMGMAVKVAGNLARAASGPVEDMRQAGFLGLAEAMLRFDRCRGVRFSTFAWAWIKRRVAEELLTCNTARPVWRRRTEGLVDRRAHKLAMELGRPASDREIADSMGVGTRWVRSRRDVGVDVPMADLAEIGPAVADPAEESSFQWLAEAIDELPRLQRVIIEARFGFAGRPVARGRLAADLGITPGAVRRLEGSAVEALGRARPLRRRAA